MLEDEVKTGLSKLHSVICPKYLNAGMKLIPSSKKSPYVSRITENPQGIGSTIIHV